MSGLWGPGRKCRQAWSEGVRLLDAGHRDAAAAAFTAAVAHDPSAADAWLGLHAAGVRQDEALTVMDRTAHSFGALRNELAMPLKSQYEISPYVVFRLELIRDLWLAAVSRHLDHGRLDEAWQRLSTAVLDCDETRFVCARYAYLRQNWTLLGTTAEPITDRFLRDQSQLYIAYGLLARGIHREALSVLEPLPLALCDSAHFRGEAAYLRGRAYEELGRTEEALAQYEKAYRYHPGFGDVAQRVAGRRGAAGASDQSVHITTITPTHPAPPQGPPAEPPAEAAGAGADDATESEAAERARAALLDEARAELDAMVGLAPVKEQVRTLTAQLRMAAIRRAGGIGTAATPQHLVLTGPPGTGKTTVARIIGKIYAGLGLLERGHLVEATRVDFVGQYLGATAIKTNQVIDSALDGILFVDEAYSLVNAGYHNGDAFGQEAVQALLKRAEDDRHRLVVVLAGYPAEIDGLLSANPGLASRFSTRVDFPAYAAGELVRITASFFEAQGDVLTEDADRALAAACDLVVAEGLVDRLGNGRFARELARRAAAVRDLRVHDLHGIDEDPTTEEITTVLAVDVMDAYHALVGSLPNDD
ncbi:AAA family ATPase [Streptomyces bambusae]|uniref:AAA family ATPase n=1 Tax=Streptomyces bambusae TaxID=1550616 RepID=UPI001CFC7D0D|nr:AAA family ATPase [Streptomyces bambusae]MCB5167664.1 AAA family ATPase [Streptomyces bambusae]